MSSAGITALTLIRVLTDPASFLSVGININRMKASEIKVGTPVIYWGVIKDDGRRFDPLKTVIASEPWKLGHGEEVCKVAGKSGGVSLRHLDQITAGSLMAAKLSGLKEISDEDIAEATRDYFTKNGVNAEVSVGKKEA